MQILDLMKLLKETSERNKAPLFLCGGLPRDKYMGILDKVNDIDLTTGTNKVFGIAKEIGFELRKTYPNLSLKEAADGHISIHVAGLKVDFSSNFIVPGIQGVLERKGIEPTPVNCEMWSRDFTCNALIMDLDMLRIKDATKRGIPDIKDKMIRTILPPELAFRYNEKRIIRAIYMATKLGFDVAPDIISWIRKNPKYVKATNAEFLTKNINKSLIYNTPKTIELINKMNLWDYIPISDELLPYYEKYSALNTIKAT